METVPANFFQSSNESSKSSPTLDKSSPMKSKSTSVEHEAWLYEQYDNYKWISVPPNPSYIWFGPDIFCPELPFQKHLKLVRLQLKERGNKPIVASITVGEGLMTKTNLGILQIWIPYEIQVSYS